MLLLLFLLIFGRHRATTGVTLFWVVLEIVLINAIITLNGAASNPFNSMLLVPLVLGLMFLPFNVGFLVLVLSISAQSLQLAFPAPHQHGEMMQGHAQGMILSFILTSLLVATVIFYFRLQLSAKTTAIHQLRERQLRDEQLLAIGTAAAQLTHDAASPVQTMRLILEEMEDSLNTTLLRELEVQFTQLETLLKDWRHIADDVREARTSLFEPVELITSIRHLLLLARPEAQISWPANIDIVGHVKGDRTLVPALANIVINACDGADNRPVTIGVSCQLTTCLITVINPISSEKEFPKDVLGSRFIDSQSGFGVGAVLSNATIEKYGGKVSWESSDNSVTTVIALPLVGDGDSTVE